jgi:hypothetical protein
MGVNDNMTTELAIVTWVKPDGKVGVEPFYNETKAALFTDKLRDAYDLIGLDWDLKITTHYVVVKND